MMAAHIKPRQPWEKAPRGEEKLRQERQAKTDMTITSEDRHRIPLKLHDTRQVDALGAPLLAEAFLTYLTGESSRSGHTTRLERILRELEVAQPKIFVIMATHYRFGGTSQRETAAALFTSQATVSRALDEGHAWLKARYEASPAEDA